MAHTRPSPRPTVRVPGPRRASGRGRLAVLAAVGALAVAACTNEPVQQATSPTTATPAPTTTTTTTVPPYPPSPTSLQDALTAMDGLYAPSVLAPATVGLDPLALRGDPVPLMEAVAPDRLVADVRRLAEPRGEDEPDGLAAAADIVVDAFQDSGYRVEETAAADPAAGGAPIVEVRVRGVTCPGRSLVVTAHYDAPAGSPGAWDASGVAALLEVARVLAERPQSMSVRLVAHPVGAEGPGTATEVVDASGDGAVATLALDGLGIARPELDDDGLVGLSPVSVHLVGDRGSEYLARVVALSTGRFLPSFWAFTSVADLDVFPQFADRDAQPWWDGGREALLVTDTGTRRDDRVGTDDDDAEIIDRDLLANGVRAVLAGVVGVGSLDVEGDGEPDVCQRSW